ncbi:MAG: von Willebrand factor type A domain-containing protein, partial [Bdellovibrionia bacterium]
MKFSLIIKVVLIATLLSCSTAYKSEEFHASGGKVSNEPVKAGEMKSDKSQGDDEVEADLAEESVLPEESPDEPLLQLERYEKQRPSATVSRRKNLENKMKAPAKKEAFRDEMLPPMPEIGQLPKSEPLSNTEDYEQFEDNKFIKVQSDPLSTFSIDVDTASYANLRRMLTQGSLPPRDAVRIEELINYFPYDYKAPQDSEPLAVQIDAVRAPWNTEHQLVRGGIKGKDLKKDDVKPSNLVFLIDVSGSMEDENKLPLLKKAFRKLVENLDGRDRVSIVVYAGASGVVLDSTSADSKVKILEALDRLQAGGSTNGGDGIQLAYQLATKNFLRDGNNRVILATDGDWNVGLTGHDDLVQLIKQKADGGVYLSVLGFGMGNYKDALLEKISKNGSGNYFYIDTVREAEKVLVNQLSSTLFTIAKDVKIQIEFNPTHVESFRLIGYENRIMDHRDFNDDTKDAGEIGAGFSVTALYELVPKAGAPGELLNLK